MFKCHLALMQMVSACMSVRVCVCVHHAFVRCCTSRDIGGVMYSATRTHTHVCFVRMNRSKCIAAANSRVCLLDSTCSGME